MAVQLLPMIVGATRPQVSFDASTCDGVPEDITGLLVQIALLRPDGSKLVRTAIMNDPTHGQATFTWQPGDFAMAGLVQSQIIITFPDQGVLKLQGPTFDVKPSFS